jgi:hypothetical protein
LFTFFSVKGVWYSATNGHVFATVSIIRSNAVEKSQKASYVRRLFLSSSIKRRYLI